MTAEVAAFALLALAGAPHCAGMCGGLVVASGGRSARRQLAFVGGKALTYGLLGLALASGGHAALHGGAELLGDGEPLALSRGRAVLAWMAGVALVLAGSAALGLRLSLPRAGLRVTRVFAHVHRSVVALPGATGAFGSGLLCGLLPCGLSWSAFALAFASEPWIGFLGLVVFGLATAPALLAVGLGWRAVPEAWRARARVIGGVVLILLGVFTAARGGLPGAQRALPECCAER